MSEHAILSTLDVENVRAHVEHICEKIPSRLAGSENARRMAEYSHAALRAAKIEAAIHTIPGLVSFPDKAEFKVVSPVEMTIEANTLGHSVPTPPEGVSGLLLDVYSGAFKDYEGKDARGTITLSELSYHPARHEKQRVAGLLGAAGCVMMNWGADDNAVVPFGSVKPAWGNPTPDNAGSEMPVLPCIGIARTEGLKLRELAKQGPVRVWFRTNVENGWRPIQVTTGEIAAGAERRLRRARRAPGLLVRARRHRQRGRQLLRDGAGARLQPASRPAASRTRARLLGGARDRHDDRLVVVRRPPLGPAPRPHGRLRADRSAVVHGDHVVGDALERRAAPLPSRHRAAAHAGAARCNWRRADEDRRRVVLRARRCR